MWRSLACSPPGQMIEVTDEAADPAAHAVTAPPVPLAKSPTGQGQGSPHPPAQRRVRVRESLLPQRAETLMVFDVVIGWTTTTGGESW